MRLFLDTSALIKRYIEEQGTVRVVAACNEAEEILLSVLVLPEALSAFSRLRREAKLPPRQYESLKSALLEDLTEAEPLGLSPAVLEKTIFCLEQTSLGAADALHVGAALFLQPDLFMTADRQQGQAAERLGLSVEILSI